jgi:hypothetical protein
VGRLRYMVQGVECRYQSKEVGRERILSFVVIGMAPSRVVVRQLGKGRSAVYG